MFAFEKEFKAILEEFRRTGALEHLVLIGSWCLPVYREHYPFPRFAFNTSDVDFSIRRLKDLEKSITVPIHLSLTRLGYVPRSGILNRAEKYIPAPTSETNGLNIEFLCEPGRNLVEPTRLPKPGIVVVPLPFQKILIENSLILAYGGIPVKVPKPAVWAIHKIAVSQRRTGKDSNLKMIKDLENARTVIQGLGKESVLREAGRFKGKFKALFLKGYEVLSKKFDSRLPL